MVLVEHQTLETEQSAVTASLLTRMPVCLAVLEKHGSMAMELMSRGSRWSRSGPSDDGR